MDKEKLIGRTVTAYLDGGWDITGVVMSFSKDKIVIDMDGNLYLIFKSKVSALLVSAGDAAAKTELPGREAFAAEEKAPFPSNKIEYEESGMYIPGDLLSEEARNLDENTFSSFFSPAPTDGANRDKNLTGISFVAEDDSE
jgi:sRNA-binding regulator protein Hfq